MRICGCEFVGANLWVRIHSHGLHPPSRPNKFGPTTRHAHWCEFVGCEFIRTGCVHHRGRMDSALQPVMPTGANLWVRIHSHGLRPPPRPNKFGPTTHHAHWCEFVGANSFARAASTIAGPNEFGPYPGPVIRSGRTQASNSFSVT